MDQIYKNRISDTFGGTPATAAASKCAPVPFTGGRASLRLVHGAGEQLTGYAPRTEIAKTTYQTLRIDLRRTGNSWSCTSTPRQGNGLACRNAFDCRVWRRGATKPVVIAAIANGTGLTERAGVGATLAVSALLNILEDDMAGYLQSGRLASLLRGAVGEVQLLLESQARQAAQSIEDYATTLVAVILTDNGGVIGQIGGGGSVMVQGESGAWNPAQWSHEAATGDRAPNLTDDDAFTALQISKLPSLPRRVLISSRA